MFGLAATALLLWLPQNAAHECAHALAHAAAGDRVTKIWPFPSRARDGHLRFAHMRYERTAPVTPFVDGLCSSAPQAVNTAVLLALIPAHWLHGGVALTVLAAWALVNYVDGAVNLGAIYRSTPKPTTDAWQTVRHWGLDPTRCRVGVAVWHLLMGVHVATLLWSAGSPG